MDYNNYFVSRINGSNPLDGNDKFAELQRASAEKIAQLQQLKEQQLAAEKAARRTLAGQLGLSMDTVAGKAVNAVANVYDGVFRGVGSVATTIPNLVAAADQANLTEQDIEALNRHAEGTATPEDLARINRKVAPKIQAPVGIPADQVRAYQESEQAKAQARADANPDAPTPLSIWKEMNVARKASGDIEKYFNTNEMVDQTSKNALNISLEGTFNQNSGEISKGVQRIKDGHITAGSTDVISGVTKLLLGGVGDLLSNPQAVGEYAFQNAPQLFVGLAGKTGAVTQLLDNIGTAANTYNQGIRDYQAKNNGALPPEDQRQKMALYAASHAAAETFGDKIGLAATKLGGHAATDLTRANFKQAIKGVAAGAGEGFVSEAPTEAFQQFAEGEITGKPATGAEIFAAGAIGGASGAALSGGGRTVTEMANLAAQPGAPKPEKMDLNKVQQTAIDSGDVSALLDPKSKAYSPTKAIAALFGHSQKADTTDEQRQANLEKANSIVTDLESQQENAVQQHKISTVDGLKELIAEKQAQLQDPAINIDPGNVDTLNKLIQMHQEDLAALTGNKDADKIAKASKEKLDTLAQRLDEATNARDGLQALVQGKSQTDADIALLSGQTGQEANDAQTAGVAPRATPAGGVSHTAEHTAAAERIVNLAMSAPEQLDTKAVANLVADKANALTTPQREYLSAFLRAQQTNPTLTSNQVAEDIYEGKKGNKGVLQYRNDMQKAMSAGNEQMARKQVDGMAAFATAHKAKAAAAAEALKSGLGTSILKVNGQWTVGQPGVPPTKEQHAEGGRAITSARLALNIKNESQALEAVAAELQAAYDLKFTKGTTNVTDTAQQGSGTQSQSKGSTNQVANQSGNTTTTTTTGTANEQSAGVVGQGVVEASGVAQSKTTESSSTEKTTNTEEPLGSSVNTEVTETTEKTSSNNQSTAENTTQEVTEPVAESSQPAGVLTTMTKKSPEGTAFNQRNLVADFFTQTAGKESDKTLRPLVAIKDFLSQMTSKTVLNSLSIPELTSNQLKLLSTFKKAATSWQSVIQNNLDRKKNSEFFYEDMMQFLIQGTENGLSMDENIKTAMAYAAYSWIAENGTKSAFNTPEEINLILGRDEDHEVSIDEFNALGHVGTRQHVVANTLGQRAVQALGLKAIKGAPDNLTANLESALGAHIFKMMLDEGILERYVIPGEKMRELTGSLKTQINVEFQFLRLARDENLALHPKAQTIVESVRGTQGILDKLFQVESGLKEPSLEPIPFNQSKTKNTDQGVPAKLAEVMEHENNVASYVRQDMWQLVNQLDDETMLEIAGAEHLEDKHAINVKKVEATNDGLARELDRFKGFVSNMTDLASGLYFEHTVWKQQRVGIATNVINPQTSKIHRHMLYRQAWETKIDPNDQAQLGNFHLRVAEGLGVKTDKQENTKSLDKYRDKVSDPAIKAAVEVLVQMLQGEDMTPAKQKLLLAGVKAGGEKMHSLDALMALAHEQFANGKPFTTHLMGEVDGVTNGPMLTHLLMGAANSVKDLFSLLNRGGFYEEGNAHSQYNQWRGAVGNFDLYEITALHMTQRIQDYINKGEILYANGKPAIQGAQVGKAFTAIYTFTGTLALNGVVQKEGRNIIKTPLTAMVFGSAVSAAVESMANNFVESIYAKIEDLATGKGDRDQIINHINTLLAIGRGGYQIPVTTSTEKLMETKFKEDQVEALKKAFKLTVGSAVGTTMKEDFGPFMDKRAKFNKTAQLSFEMYNAIYTSMREQLVKELVESGGIAYKEVSPKDANGKAIKDAPKIKQPLHGLTAEQERTLNQRLKAITPMLHTLMSKDSKQLGTGLFMAKSKKQLSNDPVFEGNVKFGIPFPGTPTMSTGTRGFEVVNAAPGVAMAPMSVHSTDSAIMHYSLGTSEALNIHDAKGVGVGGFQEAAQSLNQSTWNAMLNYSPAREMFHALSRTLIGTAELIQEGKLPPSTLQALANTLKAFADDNEMSLDAVLQYMAIEALASANHADSIKFGAMSTMQAIDQYALQGGNYVVTAADRAEAKSRLEASQEKMSPRLQEAIDTINETILSEKASPDAKLSEEVDFDKATPVSPFGTLGQSSKSDPALVKFFNENPKATAKQVIEFLYRKLHDDSSAKNRDFNMKLLKVLLKTVNPKLTVNLVNADTVLSDVVGAPEGTTLGWYSQKGTDEAVYIVGSDFSHANMQVEVLLHELVHAATAYGLTTTAGKAHYAALNSLLEQAKKYAKDNGITKFDKALSSVDELVAYGMTNSSFQQMLAQVSIPTFTNGTISNGLQKFIGILVNLLGFRDISAAKGLGVLITNVSALMEQAANTQSGTQTKTLSMAAMPQSFNTLDIHEALDDGALTPEFDNHLRNLLDGIVTHIHGPFGALKASLTQNTMQDPVDIWAEAVRTGEAPFASQAIAHIGTSSQVAHALEQVEATIRAALTTNEHQTKAVYRELSRLYTEAESLVKPADLYPGNPAKGQALYDFLFKIEKSNGDRSDYIARFAALGLAHPVINEALKVATTRNKANLKGKTILEGLQTIFETILRFFNTKVTHTYDGQPADAKLKQLVTQLIHIEAKRRSILVVQGQQSNFLEPLEENVQKFTDAIGDKVKAIAASKYIQNHKSPIVTAAGNLVGVVVGGQVDHFMKGLFDLRAVHFKERFGLAASLVQNLRGQNPIFQSLLRMTKILEGDRQDMMAGWAKSAMSAFEGDGKQLKGKEPAAVAARKAITRVFMRTGAHTLLGHFSMKDMEKLVKNKAELDKAIASFEDQLKVSGPNLHAYYTKQANALGFYKAQGHARHGFLVLNAHNIARLAGTGQQAKVTDVQATQAEQLLKPLISLYALRYSDAVDMQHAGSILGSENQRSNGNGVEFTLKLQQKLEQESMDRLFNGNPALMVHGYTSEIFDPHVDIQVANDLEGKALLEQGYVKGAPVKADPSDPDQDRKHIYVMKDGGLPRFVSGAISNRGKNAKGTTIHNGYLNPYNATGIANASTNADILNDRIPEIRDLFRPGSVPNLSTQKGTFMVPVMNELGEVVNWRYTMDEATKDEVLLRENRFDKVLGAIAGSVYDKATSREQNKAVVEALYDQYSQEYKSNSAAYLLISPKSTDPEMRQIWNLLPEDTRNDIQKVWGMRAMYVRADNLDIVFGYRKLTVGTVFDKANTERDARAAKGLSTNVMALKDIDAWQKLIVMLFEGIYKGEALVRGMNYQDAERYARKAKVTAVRGERIIQELVAEAKDLIVVKSGIVLLGNVKSNLWLLAMSGVPITSALQNHMVAWKGAIAWKDDSEALNHLKRVRDTGYHGSTKAEVDRQINRLEDSLARNPIKDLVEAGLMPTIVEDIDPENDVYSYKSQLVRKVEGFTKKVNPHIMDVAKVAYVAHDTKLYQVMHQMTQLSDFMARYTMYQHLVSRKKDPLTVEEATQRVSEAFVNYDIPMHRTLQYTDDMGITMFTKYFLGMQKVLADTLRENPARVLTGSLLAHFLGLGPTVLEGSMWHRIGNNPFQWGPFELLSGMDELPIVNTTSGLIDLVTPSK